MTLYILSILMLVMIRKAHSTQQSHVKCRKTVMHEHSHAVRQQSGKQETMHPLAALLQERERSPRASFR